MITIVTKETMFTWSCERILLVVSTLGGVAGAGGGGAATGWIDTPGPTILGAGGRDLARTENVQSIKPFVVVYKSTSLQVYKFHHMSQSCPTHLGEGSLPLERAGVPGRGGRGLMPLVQVKVKVKVKVRVRRLTAHWKKLKVKSGIQGDFFDWSSLSLAMFKSLYKIPYSNFFSLVIF